MRLLAGRRAARARLLSYAYPAPDGFAEQQIGPEGAYFSTEFQQFLLPYETVRAAPDPDRAVAEFLRTTYEAAADLGHWDRSTLEDDPLRWHRETHAP